MTITITSLYELAFWAAVIFITFSAVIGLMGVWIKEFWESDISGKLLATGCILSLSSIAVAVLARLLG